MIKLALFGLAVPLSLLPFFHWFRGTPHQLAAIKELEERMPEELLAEEDNAWFEAWKASGIDQEVYMPYFTQLDNKTGTGFRECFSSRLRWWQRIGAKLSQMTSTTLSALRLATRRLSRRI